MTRQAQATRALAKTLAPLVLSRETILRQAHGVLRAPELVEVPGQASALALWMAVLERARAEGAVQALVQAVLDENPGADALRDALSEWAASELRSDGDAPSPSLEDGRASSANARATRWWKLGLSGMVGAALLATVARLTRNDGAAEAANVNSKANDIAQRASALTPAPALSPLARAIHARVLGRCWRDFVESRGQRAPTAVHVECFPGQHGNVANVRFRNLTEADYADFRSCVGVTATSTHFGEPWSAPVEDVQVILSSG